MIYPTPGGRLTFDSFITHHCFITGFITAKTPDQSIFDIEEVMK